MSTPLALADARNAGPVTELRFAPDNKTVASVHEHGVIMTWAVDSKKLLQKFDERIHRSLWGGQNVALSDDQRLVCVNEHGVIKLCSTRSGIFLQEVAGGEAGKQAAFSPDGTVLTLMTGDRQISMWRATAPSELVDIAGSFPGCETATFSQDNLYLALWSSMRETIVVYHVDTLEISANVDAGFYMVHSMQLVRGIELAAAVQIREHDNALKHLACYKWNLRTHLPPRRMRTLLVKNTSADL